MSRAIVLFAHGARDPEWAVPFKHIQRAVAEKTRASVELAFLELMQPSLDEAIARLANSGASEVSVFPLFLAPGRHLTRDLPLLVAQIHARNPDLRVEVRPPLGEVDEILEAIAGWVCKSL